MNEHRNEKNKGNNGEMKENKTIFPPKAPKQLADQVLNGILKDLSFRQKIEAVTWMGLLVNPSLHQPRLFPFLQLEDHIWFGKLMPQGNQVLIVLQHHIFVHDLLSSIQQLPLLPGEVHKYILEGHQCMGPGS